MPCYSPVSAWEGDVLRSGKREILFKRPKVERASVFQLKLPCGQCIGCRLERSRQWAMRCVHEASLYEDNCFITLTYGPDSIPSGGSLRLRDFQLFMKRLRKHVSKSSGKGCKLNDRKVGDSVVPPVWGGVRREPALVGVSSAPSLPGVVRFFHCGEYGDRLGRPHYHALLFNYDFQDKYVFRKSERGDTLWRSPTLEALWTAGQSMIGAVTFESAAYVARYVMKKVTGDMADEHYADKVTGELRSPEYVTMSRGSKRLGTGGIGRGWYNKFKSDIFPRDYAIVRGMKVGVPKFYDGLYELEDPEGFLGVKRKRVCNGLKLDPTGFGETGDARLRVKEEVKRAQIRSLSRNLEV